MAYIYLLLLFMGSGLADDCPGCHEHALCHSSGSLHYVTYDGFYYDFMGSCSYLLSGDCYTNLWKVVVHHEPLLPRVHATVSSEVNVLYNGHNATITRNSVLVDGVEVDGAGYTDGNFKIYMFHIFVVVEIPAGVVVSFNQMGYAKVGVSSRWYGKTCGLCGVWDDDVTDDNLNANHEYSHAEYLEGEQFCESTPPCPGCVDDTQKEIAKKRCVEELEKIKCPEVDYNLKLQFCLYDYCCCGESCLCSHLNDYLSDCYWETKDDKYTQKVCNSTNDNYSETCTVTGDPHFVIFDHLQYTFNSECWYLLAKDECDGVWEVHIHTAPRTAGSREIVVSEAMIRIHSTHIDLGLEDMRPIVAVNGEILVSLESFTWEEHDLVAFEDHNIVYISSDVGIKVYFGLYYFKIGVSTRWSGKTCGLCGSWNMDVEDDKILADPYHAHLWARPGEICPEPQPKPRCKGVARRKAVRKCERIMNYLQPRCPTLPTLPYKQFCIDDLCSLGYEHLCKIIIPYFTECFIQTGSAEHLDSWIKKCSRETQTVCYASGDPHFGTFDKTNHHFQGVCEYVFAEDCVDNRFKVLTQNSPSYPGARVSTVTKVSLIFDNITVVIDRNQITLQGVPFFLPKIEDEYIVYRHGRRVIIKVHALDLQVSYDQRSTARVSLSEKFYGKTCGLCGKWNNDISDENTMNADHTLMHQSFLVQDLDCYVPEPPKCNKQDKKEAERKCDMALKKLDCEVVDYMDYMEACILDLCVCGEACLCDHIQAYVEACYEATDEEVYNYDPCPDPPMPSAFCTARGGSHYTTFDGHIYDFAGLCWYVLAKDDDQKSWEIQIRNEQLRPTVSALYLSEVRVLIGNTVFDFTANGSIQENGTDIINTLPDNDAAGCDLFIAHGFVNMDCTRSLGFLMKCIGSYIKVEIDHRWLGKTSGLCATWDMDKTDDELYNNPVHANTAAVMGHNCSFLPNTNCSGDDIQKANETCEVLKRFSSMCSESVMTRGFSNCISDICACGETCLCSSIADFVADCVDATKNYKLLDVWPDLVHVCPDQQEESKAWCVAMGDPHYYMFDGIMHHFQGMCEYVFAADCNGYFKVITDNKEYYTGASVAVIARVTIQFEDVEIIMSHTDVTINGTVAAGNVYEDNYTMIEHGRGRTIYTNFGLRVYYDMKWLLKVDLDDRWKNRTCGLCGTWNDDQTDDITFTSDHKEMHNVTLYGKDCGITPKENNCTSQEQRDNAMMLCKMHLNEIACPEVDYMSFIEFCVLDVCACGEMCLCPHLYSYVSSCFYVTRRNEYTFDPCNTTMDLEYVKECDAWGDPHYTTFDGHQHDFQGMCEYVFAADCVSNTWSVITKNAPWRKHHKTSKVVQVTVIAGEIEISITLRDVKINHELVTMFPVIGPGGYFKVENIPGLTTVTFPTIGLQVTFGEVYAVSVFVSARWFNKTCGLCGLWNNDTSDEIELYSNQNVMQEVTLYGNGVCVDPPPPPECPDQLAKIEAQIVCDKLFAKYYCGLDYRNRIEQCTQDYCACGKECMCSAVRAYMLACYRHTGDDNYVKGPCDDSDEPYTGFCVAFGASNYKTFDGLHYTFQGNCWYVLSRDCQDDSWEVHIMTATPTIEGDVTTVQAVRIFIQGLNIEMERGSSEIVIDGAAITLPYLEDDVSVSEENGVRIIRALNASLTVYYIGTTVRIDLNDRWLGNTCGLCGNWNSGIFDDRLLTNSTYANTFAVDTDACPLSENIPCTEEETQDAEVRCEAIRKLPETCPESIINRYLDICTNGVCKCGEACLCDVIEAAALECVLKTGDWNILEIWRDLIHVCPGRGETGVCLAWGDPHYTTYDQVIHHFQGMCEYVFSADCVTYEWKVVTRNERFRNFQVSTVAEVTFIFGTQKIVVNRKNVHINENIVHPPVLATDYSILTHGRIVQVSTSLGVTVSYDMRYRVRVELHKRWLGKTCGLCGIWNNNKADEVSMAANHTGMHYDFLYGKDKCDDLPDTPVCSSEKKEKAQKKCKEALDRIKCPEVNIKDAIEFCVYDECICGDECFCPNLQSYYEDCYDATKDKYYLQNPCHLGNYTTAECLAGNGLNYQTFDKFSYSFQEECWYVLAKDCNGSWEVQTKHVKHVLTRTAAGTHGIEAIKIRVGKHVVEMNAENFEIKLDSMTYDLLTVSLIIPGQDANVYSDRESKILYTNSWTLEYTWYSVKIALKNRWVDKMCGLCGNWNFDVSDDEDLADRDVAKTWAVPGQSCSGGPVAKCTTEQIQSAQRGGCGGSLHNIQCPTKMYEVNLNECSKEECICDQDCLCKSFKNFMVQCYKINPCNSVLPAPKTQRSTKAVQTTTRDDDENIEPNM